MTSACIPAGIFARMFLARWCRKESTCRCVAPCSGGEEIGGGAVAGWCGRGDAVFLLEQGQGFADHVADGGSADVAERVGQDIQGAQSPVVEQGEQDAFVVADLLVEDTAAGAGLAQAAAPLVDEALGLGGLPCGQACGEVMQLARVSPVSAGCDSCSMTVARAGRRSPSAKASRASQVVNRTGATPGSWR